jgi:hypothetical protein
MSKKKLPRARKGDLPLMPGDPTRDPYAEGADAALAGASDTTNPYPIASDEEASWNDGYLSIADYD